MKLISILLLVLFSVTTLVTAQDTDPQLEDNWCATGNIWDDGRCGEGSLDTQTWHWTCGWYMRQVDKAIFSLDELRVNVPLCESIYPQISENAIQSEVVNSCTNPDDSDCDGLMDDWEMIYFGNLNQTASDDPDGDGCNNLCEQSHYTRPI